jgi:tetratricopeptide (TPR) repeat protein
MVASSTRAYKSTNLYRIMGFRDIMGSLDKLFGQVPWVGTKLFLMEGNRLKKACRTETLEEAIQSYDRAIEHDPHCAEAWYKKGHCYHLLKNDEEAIRCYEEALKIHSRDAEVWYNKGQSLHLLNRETEAQYCLRKAEEIDPRYKEFIRYSIPGTLVRIVGQKPDGTYIIQMPPDPRKWSH